MTKYVVCDVIRDVTSRCALSRNLVAILVLVYHSSALSDFKCIKRYYILVPGILHVHIESSDRACRGTQDNDDSAQFGLLILTILAKPHLYNPNCSEP